ncbi:MAG: hypothetical protein OEW30_04775 [Acidimicrobiia bacterium]|nr:hypothetical protein [Acidimicrobiia bacterium]MDH5293771.1 hypothetical protein [Acidimicrobiia bacterium]
MRSTAAAEHPASQVTSPVDALRSLLPTGVFLVFDNWFGLSVAMIAASVTTVAFILLRRRSGAGVGILLPVSLGFVTVKAIAGVMTGSSVVYFGAGVALSALAAVAIGTTAFTRHPAASYAMPLVTPYRHLTPDHPVYRRVSAHVTVAVAAAELAITAWEGWHLTVASASEFVVIRTLAAWPVMGVVIFFAIFYIRFRLDRYEHALRSGADAPAIATYPTG